jgi:hypothetical protein
MIDVTKGFGLWPRFDALFCMDACCLVVVVVTLLEVVCRTPTGSLNLLEFSLLIALYSVRK